MWEIVTGIVAGAYAAAWLIGWVALAYVVAVMAEDRGRPPLLWFVLGLVFPLVSLVALLIWASHDRPVLPAGPWPPDLPDEELGFGVAAAPAD